MPEAASAGGDYFWIRMISFAVMAAFIGSGVISQYRGKAATALRDAGIWMTIILVLMVLYSFREEFGVVTDRFRREAMPTQAMQIDEGVLAITRSQGGHYVLDAKVNKEATIRFMVDTGASRVVLSKRDATRIGFDVDQLSYTEIANTANGTVMGAPVKLRSVQVGDYVIHNVSATVNDGEMVGSLLGMTFLDQLAGYSVRDDTLTLEFE